MSAIFDEADRPAFEAMLLATELAPLVPLVRAGRYDQTLVEQAIVPEARIFRVRFKTGNNVRKAHVAALDDGWKLLTGHVESFNEIAARAPRALDDVASVRAYATTADAWTTTWEFGQLEIASLDDIPWNNHLQDWDRRTLTETKERFATTVGPERISMEPATATIETWIVASCTLVLRKLVVTIASGAFERIDQIAMENLPVPYGRYWDHVGDRYLPVG